ncbi:transcriptional regulator GcvA [Minwuia sp.]|uniref:transcriptional regulator GcvA n=1 Tax=Minwuia sp. TaxID=2493630 RepID=UPI003A91D6E6
MSIRWDLPPLTALRSFEAAARHLSMSGGASELNVTHAAISQQVRALEDWLGAKLFVRGKRLELTAEGTALAGELMLSFERIESAARAIRRRADVRHLEVATTIAFASRWLTPRLGRFQIAHPDISIRLSPSRHVVDFQRDQVDVAIRHGDGDWPGLTSERFLAGRMVAVCHPSLLKAGSETLKPDDLNRINILHDTDYEEWHNWVQINGWKDVDVRRGDVFGLTTLAYEAALAGNGIALMVESLVRTDIEEKRLVALFDEGADYNTGYYLVYRAQDAGQHKIAAFLDWMRSEGTEA